MADKEDKLGQIAYCAYSLATGAMKPGQPAFRELPEQTRRAWIETACAVLRYSRSLAPLGNRNRRLGHQSPRRRA